MKKTTIYKTLSGLLLCSSALVVSSCNDKSDSSDSNSVLIVPNVAVTDFTLTADDDVLADLDSVFFSIDLEHGVIFNADSLPKGTQIDKLIPVIEYSSYVTTATITMEGGTTRTGTVDYIESPTDSIDFTGKVTLTLATENDAMKKDFILKVNVHNQVTDSLVWDQLAVASLPSRLANPRNQKSVQLDDKVITIIEESDGTYTYATSTDLFSNEWTRTQISFPFTPNLRSLAAADNKAFIMDAAGNLYQSTDGNSWINTGETWNTVIGTYLDTVLGLKTTSEGLVYTQYPVKDINETAVDPEFPIEGFSNFATHTNKWTTSPIGFIAGGVKADGSLSNATWAFDGTEWVDLCNGGIPAVKGASLIPYYNYRQLSSDLSYTELDIWMLLGGELEDGSLNRLVYISYDNGVNWKCGDDTLQLPESFPAMTECDNVVLGTSKDADLADAWKVTKGSATAHRKSSYTIDGNTITWECPYIYLLGGYNSNNQLYNTIWRGALNRLTFVPII